MSALDSDLVQRTRELGGVISPERAAATNELYAALHEIEPFDGIEIVRDQRYGPHERNRLDVFLGRAAQAARAGEPPVPVVAFVHGGNFVAGDKHTDGSPFYDNVGVWAARAGYLGMTLTYRLAPGDPFPAGRDDVADASAWIHRACGVFGGDPTAIVMIGASAGATQVASAVARDAGDPRALRPAGVALLSGMYDLAEFADAGVLTPCYGADPRIWAEASPVRDLVATDVPVLLAVAEHDPPAQQRQLLLLADALLARRGRLPQIAYLPGHNHFSEVLHIGTGHRLLTDHLSSFVAGCATGADTPIVNPNQRTDIWQ
jgi:triacylglycerol lipase